MFGTWYFLSSDALEFNCCYFSALPLLLRNNEETKKHLIGDKHKKIMQLKMQVARLRAERDKLADYNNKLEMQNMELKQQVLDLRVENACEAKGHEILRMELGQREI
ncbi:hypothetical protein E1B28_000805 [Marasmius oreades]|uniref:Uncharacterized protein n=1 Tax=Marasmius oreades TaxID=181124 RepID=A0A9P7V236_9AGAR|nr:uncharacterized protein E1B28_000805 [Marasmius oreades]KAG7098905.1 hypothetical protein E1B28_000805 [Marasmius oreades]